MLSQRRSAWCHWRSCGAIGESVNNLERLHQTGRVLGGARLVKMQTACNHSVCTPQSLAKLTRHHQFHAYRNFKLRWLGRFCEVDQACFPLSPRPRRFDRPSCGPSNPLRPPYNLKTFIIFSAQSTPAPPLKVKEEHKALLDKLRSSLPVSAPQDWYRIRRRDVKGAFGFILRDFYGDSIVHCLAVLHPEYDLKPWLFAHTPANFFKDVENQRHQIPLGSLFENIY